MRSPSNTRGRTSEIRVNVNSLDAGFLRDSRANWVFWFVCIWSQFSNLRGPFFFSLSFVFRGKLLGFVFNCFGFLNWPVGKALLGETSVSPTHSKILHTSPMRLSPSFSLFLLNSARGSKLIPKGRFSVESCASKSAATRVFPGDSMSRSEPSSSAQVDSFAQGLAVGICRPCTSCSKCESAKRTPCSRCNVAQSASSTDIRTINPEPKGTKNTFAQPKSLLHACQNCLVLVHVHEVLLQVWGVPGLFL